MRAVSDSSPLILFGRIGRLDLLHDLFDELWVPAEVRSEVVEAGRGRPAAHEVETADWISVAPAVDVADVRAHIGLPRAFGPGEVAAIELALTFSPSSVLLIDDRPARQRAAEAGLRIVGTGGVTLLAKDRGLLSDISPTLEQLRWAGLRIGASEVGLLLDAAGEG